MSSLASIADQLIFERIPLCITDPDREAKCRDLAAHFASSDAARGLGAASFEQIAADLVPWVRAQGYPLLDEPVSAYAKFSREKAVDVWGPLQE